MTPSWLLTCCLECFLISKCLCLQQQKKKLLMVKQGQQFIMFQMKTFSLLGCLSHSLLVVNSPSHLTRPAWCLLENPSPLFSWGWGQGTPVPVWGCRQRQVIGCHVWRCDTGQRTMTGGATHLPNIAVTSWNSPDRKYKENRWDVRSSEESNPQEDTARQGEPAARRWHWLRKPCSDFFFFNKHSFQPLSFFLILQNFRKSPNRIRMCPRCQKMGLKVYPQDCSVAVSCKNSKPIRSVRFPNDILFQDYVRQGELERIGRFIQAQRVTLDTIYLSGENPQWTFANASNQESVFLLLPSPLCWFLLFICICRDGCHSWGCSVREPGVCKATGAARSRYPPEGRGGMDAAAHGLQRRLPRHCTVSKTKDLHTHVESLVLPQSLFCTMGWEHFTCLTLYVCSEEQPYTNDLDKKATWTEFEKILGFFFPPWNWCFVRHSTRQVMKTCHER